MMAAAAPSTGFLILDPPVTFAKRYCHPFLAGGECDVGWRRKRFKDARPEVARTTKKEISAAQARHAD
jgi:hypothetical protein